MIRAANNPAAAVIAAIQADDIPARLAELSLELESSVIAYRCVHKKVRRTSVCDVASRAPHQKR